MSVLHNYFFNITSYGWRCMNHFIHQELIKNGGFPSIIQSYYNHFVFLVREEVPQFSEDQPHHEHLAGRGVPQQQVPLRRGPRRGAGRGEPRRSRLSLRGEGTGWPRSLDGPLRYRSESAAPSLSRAVLCSEPTEPHADP